MLRELSERGQGGAPVHFVGVGGIGVASLARIFHGAGHPVSGSDLDRSPLTDELGARGIRVEIGHRAANVPAGTALVVCSAAIRPDHPELEAARARGIPVMKYAQVLGRLMGERARGIAVAGTHGKTTTTAMIAHILVEAGEDPTMVVGGNIPALGGTCRVGASDLMVAEACEYDRSFLNLRPAYAIVTNVEEDHLDYYRDLAEIRGAFRTFAASVPAHGRIFCCAHDAQTVATFRGLVAPLETYAIDDADADWVAADLDLSRGRPTYTVVRGGAELARVELVVPGWHNALNSLGAIAVAHACGVPVQRAARALATFGGVNRRFQVLGTCGGATVVDDYAHHPTEIRAVLRAARDRFPGARVVALFQPHQHSRTRQLLGEFAEALAAADAVVLADIYAARDSEDERRAVRAQDLADAIGARGTAARHIPGFEEIAAHVRGFVRPGDAVVTMGAGDIWKVAHALAKGGERGEAKAWLAA